MFDGNECVYESVFVCVCMHVCSLLSSFPVCILKIWLCFLQWWVCDGNVCDEVAEKDVLSVSILLPSATVTLSVTLTVTLTVTVTMAVTRICDCYFVCDCGHDCDLDSFSSHCF